MHALHPTIKSHWTGGVCVPVGVVVADVDRVDVPLGVVDGDAPSDSDALEVPDVDGVPLGVPAPDWVPVIVAVGERGGLPVTDVVRVTDGDAVCEGVWVGDEPSRRVTVTAADWEGVGPWV